jgi:hypothetical protein
MSQKLPIVISYLITNSIPKNPPLNCMWPRGCLRDFRASLRFCNWAATLRKLFNLNRMWAWSNVICLPCVEFNSIVRSMKLSNWKIGVKTREIVQFLGWKMQNYIFLYWKMQNCTFLYWKLKITHFYVENYTVFMLKIENYTFLCWKMQKFEPKRDPPFLSA